jgi:hypothetical protein
VASKAGRGEGWRAGREKTFFSSRLRILSTCLLYTSDTADDVIDV